MSDAPKLDPSDPAVVKLRATLAEARRLVDEGLAKSAPLMARQRKVAESRLALLDRAVAVLEGREPLPGPPPALDPAVLWQLQLDYERATASGRAEEAKQELASFVKQLIGRPRGRPQVIDPALVKRIRSLHDHEWPPGRIARQLRAEGLTVSRQLVANCLRHHYGVEPHKD